MIVATIFLTAAAELTYLAKTQSDIVENLQTRIKLTYASESGAEIFRAWTDLDPTLGDPEKFSTESNFKETEVYRFETRDKIPVRVLLLQDRVFLDANRRAWIFASTAQLKDSRFKNLKRLETTYGLYYFDSQKVRHWFGLYR